VGYLHTVAGMGCLGELTDQQILERFARLGDQSAFAVLVRRHGRLVHAACRRVLVDEADVEDAFQATFLVLLRKANSIPWRASLGSWLYGVAHRVAVQARSNAYRRQLKERRAARDAADASSLPDLSWREACDILHQELDRLPDKFRLPLLLCYLHGLSRDEAAQRLGCSTGAVRGNLERGRKRLHARLTRRGVTLTAGLLTAVAAPVQAFVPIRLVDSTVSLAISSTTPAAAAGNAALLAEGVLDGMNTTRRILMAVAALAVAIAGTGIGLTAGFTPFSAPPEPPIPVAQQTAKQAEPSAQTQTIAVRGQVLAPDGKPVAGARLYTYRKTAGRSPAEDRWDLVEGGKSGADGRFQFDTPKTPIFPPGDQHDLIPVFAAADGYGCVWTNLAPTANDLTLRLLPDQPITGRVLDTEGRPVAGATVRVESVWDTAGKLDSFVNGWKRSWEDAYHGRRSFGYPPAPIVGVSAPDRDGRFRITGAGADRLVHVEVRGPGIAQTYLYIINRAGFDAGPVNQAAAERESPDLRYQIPVLYGPVVDFVATPSRPVEGVVREAGSGRPVAGAQVMSTIAYSNSVDAKTDAAGRFRLEGLPKRKDYSLQVYAPDGSPLMGRSVSLADTAGLQPLTADIELGRGVAIRGRLTDRTTGQGVFGDLTFVPLQDNPFVDKPAYAAYRKDQFGTSTHPDGRFQFTTFPGPGVLVVDAHGSEMMDGKEVTPYQLADLSDEDRKQMRITKMGGN
jgi:RNA polymerase sigma factor (sigma-70 family)